MRIQVSTSTDQRLVGRVTLAIALAFVTRWPEVQWGDSGGYRSLKNMELTWKILRQLMGYRPGNRFLVFLDCLSSSVWKLKDPGTFKKLTFGWPLSDLRPLGPSALGTRNWNKTRTLTALNNLRSESPGNIPDFYGSMNVVSYLEGKKKLTFTRTDTIKNVGFCSLRTHNLSMGRWDRPCLILFNQVS